MRRPRDARSPSQFAASIPADQFTQLASPPSALSHLASRLAGLGDKSIVVQARVEDMTASLRSPPTALRWWRESHIVTRMELTVLETFCGSSPPAPLSASYLGGTLVDGTTEQDVDLTPSSLDIGDQHIFVLRFEDGECWLQAGWHDTIRRTATGTFHYRVGYIDPNDILGVCP
jgi:hypothetical protein